MLWVIWVQSLFGIYHPAIKRGYGYGKSPINEGFKGTIPYKWGFSSKPMLDDTGGSIFEQSGVFRSAKT